jgi:UDP-N-acetylmuramate dehydrogenase
MSWPGRSDVTAGSVEAATRSLGPLARLNVPLGELTTYRVGGRAAVAVEASSTDDLKRVAEALAESGLPVLVVGRGSNLLVADAGFHGIAVMLAGEVFTSIDIGVPGLDGVAVRAARAVRAGGAVQLPVLARQTAAAGLTGLEWAVGVPGSVGGAVRMNAGGHGADTSQVLRSCRWFDLHAGVIEERPNEALAFGYRHSAVEGHHVVMSANYVVAPGDREEAEATIRDIVRWRREHQPGGQNAGSVFTNPPGTSAGWLVEAAGLKGHRLGTAAVSEKHGNFIQADPGGSADDVIALMVEVQALVEDRLGVKLQAEVKLVGADEQAAAALGLEVTG